LAAKKQFRLKTLRVYKLKVVYNILRRKLPKFKLVISRIDAGVSLALILLDNDAAVCVVCMGNTSDATLVGNDSATVLLDPISLISPFPSIGKETKMLEFAHKQQQMKFSLSLQRLSCSWLMM
jgi:hypothetical protein